MEHQSLLDLLISGDAMPEQYLGVALIVVCLVVGTVHVWLEARKGSRR